MTNKNVVMDIHIDVFVIKIKSPVFLVESLLYTKVVSVSSAHHLHCLPQVALCQLITR